MKESTVIWEHYQAIKDDPNRKEEAKRLPDRYDEERAKEEDAGLPPPTADEQPIIVRKKK